MADRNARDALDGDAKQTQLQAMQMAQRIRLAGPGGQESDHGVVSSWSGPGGTFLEAFEEALAAGRHWDREPATAMV